MLTIPVCLIFGSAARYQLVDIACLVNHASFAIGNLQMTIEYLWGNFVRSQRIAATLQVS